MQYQIIHKWMVCTIHLDDLLIKGYTFLISLQPKTVQYMSCMHSVYVKIKMHCNNTGVMHTLHF